MKNSTNNIIVLQEVDSTNNYANRLIMSDTTEEGCVVLAHFQKKGKGQSGNFWESEANKNLLMSIILYPEFLPVQKQFYLSKITSLALFDFLKSETDNISIKWPNDIYVKNKKIAGILIENSVKGNFLSSSVLGIGVNINQQKFISDSPNPVSLKQITEKEYKIEQMASDLAGYVFCWYNKLRDGNLKDIDDRYFNNLYRKNEWSFFIKDGQTFEARIIGIGEYGHLILEQRNGKTDKFMFKEIEFVL